MMFFAATILISAGAAVAQQGLTQVPKCAQPCVTEFVTTGAIAGCNAYDAKCICENENFIDEIACCLVDSCTAEQQAETVKFAHEMCASVGVTDLPDEVVCRADAASTTSSDAPTASASGSDSASESQSVTESPSSTAGAAGSEDSETPNAGPAATMAPVGILGGLIAAVAML